MYDFWLTSACLQGYCLSFSVHQERFMVRDGTYGGTLNQCLFNEICIMVSVFSMDIIKVQQIFILQNSQKKLLWMAGNTSLAIVLIFIWVHDCGMWDILLKSSSHFDSCHNAAEHYDRNPQSLQRDPKKS